MNSPPRRPTLLTLISTLAAFDVSGDSQPSLNSLAEAVVEDDVVEDLAFTFVEPAGIEPERRRRELSHPHIVGVGTSARSSNNSLRYIPSPSCGTKCASSISTKCRAPSWAASRQTLCTPAKMIGASRSRWPMPALLMPTWRLRPQREQGLEILSNQFEDVGHDQDSQCWIAARDVADQVRDDDALAGCRRHRCERIAATPRPVGLRARRSPLVDTDEARTCGKWPVSCPRGHRPVLLNVARAKERGRWDSLVLRMLRQP